MKIALIIIGVIALGCLALEIVSRLVAKHGRDRFANMPPAAQRKHQEAMYNRHQMG